MKLVQLGDGHDFAEWRAAARALLRDGVRPDEVVWEEVNAGGDLFAAPVERRRVEGCPVGVVPRRFIDLAKVAMFHRDPRRFALLYRLLFRLQKHPALLGARSDPDVARLHTLVGNLRQEAERVTARRNRSAPSEVSPPAETEQGVSKVDEADPEIASLSAAKRLVQSCTRCPLYAQATQAVFGEGPASAEVMFVGEQPGDQEDLAGKPFVGPAGRVFDRTLEAVGIDRSRVYVTNAVKHFKFEPRGKRRIHQKPNSGEIQACRFWLDLEREFVRPKLVVALGATAVQSLMGKAASISSLRGRKLEMRDGAALIVTVHPSSLLRIPDRQKAAEEAKRFEADLRAVKAFIDKRGDETRHGGLAA